MWVKYWDWLSSSKSFPYFVFCFYEFSNEKKYFRFVIDDLIIKMESIFGVKQFVSDQPMQYILSPSDLFSDTIAFLPQIVKFFNEVITNRPQIINEMT